MGEKHLLIVGDTIIDHDVHLNAIGLSLESPTLKTSFISETFSFGGAARVAQFASCLGASVTFISSLGVDMFKRLETFAGLRLLNQSGAGGTLKTRYYVNRGGSRYNCLQVNRVDNTPCPIESFDRVDVESFDAVAISDYRTGFVTDELVLTLRSRAKFLYAASQISDNGANFDRLECADIIVCNEHEAQHVRRKVNVCVTSGERGCTLNETHYPGKQVVAVRTIGAGDVFYGALLATGSPMEANECAARFVGGELS
jgi:sugar/nucleoside kinase (ribokinase family)